MQNFAVNMLLSTLSVFMISYTVTQLVPMRLPALYVLLSPIIPVMFYVLSLWYFPQLNLVFNVISMAYYLLFPLLFSPFSKKAALISSAACMISSHFADLLLGIFIYLTAEGRSAPIRDKVIHDFAFMVCFKLLYILFLAVFLLLCYRFLSRVLLHKSTDSQNFLLFLIPLCQIITVDLIMVILETVRALPYTVPIFLSVTLASLIGDAAYCLAIRRMQREEVLQEQIRRAHQELGNQIAYYKQMEENMAHINQMRHDINNQLQTAYILLEKDEKAEARRQLDALHASLGDHIGARFCENLTVDAVLTEKSERCRQLGIPLEINLELPAQLPVEGTHLCSIFANLLDNAVSGCQNSQSAHPYISLQAHIKQNYLILCCRNSAGAASDSPRQRAGFLPEHGLGLEILRGIATLYHGTLSTALENGVYSSVLALSLAPPRDAEPSGERSPLCEKSVSIKS